MIHHIVMWRFADSAEGKTRKENMAIVRERLLALTAIIPEIKSIEVGRDLSRTEMSYDMALVTDFESLEALHTYKVHPAHVAVADYVKNVTVARVVLDAPYGEDGKLK